MTDLRCFDKVGIMHLPLHKEEKPVLIQNKGEIPRLIYREGKEKEALELLEKLNVVVIIKNIGKTWGE